MRSNLSEQAISLAFSVIPGAEVPDCATLRDVDVIVSSLRSILPGALELIQLRERRAISRPSQPGPCLGLAER